MNLFADLLAASNSAKATSTGPRIQQRRGVEVKSSRELKIMAEASRIVATVLREIMGAVQPGQTTGDLDAIAERRIREMGATPSFKGYHGFPASICASINNEVVHGIPSAKRVIHKGDLLKVDTGAYFDGYHGDSCVTICVGDAPEEVLDANGRVIAALDENGVGVEYIYDPQGNLREARYEDGRVEHFTSVPSDAD